ncbi:MAG TPA: CopG family transcriptional regulator [Nocardioidaceae bacterium]|nr:CopG family transcriptional regulator [Nocardioidaceae bacterium]
MQQCPPKTYKTPAGRQLTDADLDAIAGEVEHKEYDVEQLKARRRGRPTMGSGPAEVVPVRIDLELRAAVEARAAVDSTTTSEVIREALRRFLDVA